MKKKKSIYNSMSDEQFDKLCQEWSYIPNQNDYTDLESAYNAVVEESILRENLMKLAIELENMKEIPEGFQKTFSKRLKDLLA